jgi:hypothetical protein
VVHFLKEDEHFAKETYLKLREKLEATGRTRSPFALGEAEKRLEIYS